MDVIYQSRLWNVFILIFHLSLICILEEALDLIQLKVKNLGNTDGKNVFLFCNFTEAGIYPAFFNFA